MNIFYKMHVYKLLRNKEIDKNGRPVIFLSYLGKESLVWYGTTSILLNVKDKPIVLHLDNKETYFYIKGIEKVKTDCLIGKWRERYKQQGLVLSVDIQHQLISKLSELTNQEDPYVKIVLLELENQVLKKEKKVLECEKENLLSLLQQKEFER